MNEKEIIKDLKNFIALAQKEENFIYYSEYKFDNALAERVQELLNLYNKEKEKNNSISIQYEKVVDKLEDLEQIEKEHKEENGRLREENEVLRYGLRENKKLRHGLEENTEEIDKLYKIINLMAEHIENGCDFDNKIQTKQQILDYFTNKVEEDK